MNCMRHWMEIVSEGEVIPFPRRSSAVGRSVPMNLIKPVSNEPVDFELRYARDETASPTSWHISVGHGEDYNTAMHAMKLAIKRNPNADQGLEGIKWVDFIPLSDRAQQWLDDKGMIEEPRIYGKLAIISFIKMLRNEGFTLRRVLV